MGLEGPFFRGRKPESLGGIGFPFALADEVIGGRIGTRLTEYHRGELAPRSAIRQEVKGTSVKGDHFTSPREGIGLYKSWRIC